MKINIIAVGKIKEKYLKEASLEYEKRLSKFCNLQIIEVNEYVIRTENNSDIQIAKNEEGKSILSKIKNEFVVVLDIYGIELTTIEFCEKIKKIKLDGISEITFIIGGSYGLSDEVKQKSKLKMSFSKLTFPHQLFRVMLLEQIYRIFKIESNEPYHK